VPILVGSILGSKFEQNFRIAMQISRGDLAVFVERPISAFVIGLCVLLIVVQIFVRLRGANGKGAQRLEVKAAHED